MGRQRDRARRASQGLPNENYSSKSSPSYLQFRLKKDQENDLGRPYPRHHAKRMALHAQLTRDLGVPLDTVFIFRWSSDDLEGEDDRETIIIHFGTTVVINKKDLSLVLAVRCTPYKAMTPQLRTSFDQAISTPWLHSRARLPCLTNHSVKLLIEAGIYWGWLGNCGWRGGCDTGKSIGTYALNAYSAGNKSRIEDDRARMALLHEVRDFWAERFATLSFFAFESNRQVAARKNVPGFDEEEWQHTPNGQVFASNLVTTGLDFFNTTHVDFDETDYAFGMNGLIDTVTGLPHELAGSSRGRVLGGQFTSEKFRVEADPERVDGTVELVWNTKIPHRTKPCISVDQDGKRVDPTTSQVTRFGSSCQISESLVHRIGLLEEKKAEMSAEQWEIHRKSRVKDYAEETARKLMLLQEAEERKAIKKQKQKQGTQKGSITGFPPVMK